MKAADSRATGKGPVFIVGAPRSGTSILYRTLLKHPSFAVRGDEALQLGESAILKSLHSARRWKAPHPLRLWLFFLRDEQAYGRFVTVVRAVTNDFEDVPAGVRPPWTKSVLEAFVDHAIATRSCARLIEKTPTHIERAEWLLESLPAAKLLFIHRHPLDTYASYLRRARVDPKASWAALSVDEFADIFRRHSYQAQTLATTHPDRFLQVGYEAFTHDPVQEMRRVCAFLEEPFVPRMVEESSPDLTRSSNDPHLFGEITERTKEWSDFVDRRTAALVESRTESVARTLGYERRVAR